MDVTAHRSRGALRLGVAALALAGTAAFGPGAGRAADCAQARQLTPRDRVVTFQQVEFVVRGADLVIAGSDWGQVQVVPETLKKRTGFESGFVNVFVDDGGALAWVVDNLLIPPLPPISPARASSAASCLEPAKADMGRDLPMSTFFDLVPGVAGGTGGVGDVTSIDATVLLTAQPLPRSTQALDLAAHYAPARFDVVPVIEDADGSLGDLTPGGAPPTGGTDVGQPPPALEPVATAATLIPGTYIFQAATPNIECAVNQCVPMGFANALQYLEDETHAPPWTWQFLVEPEPGVGRWWVAAGQLFLLPWPPASLPAWVDARTRRDGVVDDQTGGGASVCQGMQGLLGTLDSSLLDGAAVVYHAGSSHVIIGNFHGCANVYIDMGDVISVRTSTEVTWDWLATMVNGGAGVALSFGRYATNGDRTGGHQVRVYGVASVNDVDYVYILDDGDQGDPGGLRTVQWEVEDTGRPGLPGIPDGRLNIDGTSREIEFAAAVLPFPLFDP